MSSIQHKVYSFISTKLGLKSKDENLLLKGSGQGFVLKVLGLLVAFGLQVLLARTMGTEQYGVYIYVLTWANLAGLFTKLGFDRAAKKFLPAFEAQKKPAYFGNFISYSSKNIFYAGMALLALVLVWLFIETGLDSNLKYTFVAGMLLLVINTQAGLISSFLEAVRDIVKSIIPLYFIRPVLIGSGVFIFFVLNGSLHAPAAMWLNAAATFVSLIVVWVWFKPYIPDYDRREKADKELKKEWRMMAYSLLLVSGTLLILMETDTLMLGILADTTAAGVYQTAAKIGELSMFGFNSIEIVIAPTIAGFYALGKTAEIRNILRKGVLLMLIFSMPVFLVLWFFGDFILGVYGSEFLTGFTALKILLACQFINVITGSALNLMIMTRYERAALVILAASVLLNVVLNLIFIPLYNMEGAALATGITTVVWNVGMYLFVKIKMKMDPSILSLLRKK